MTIFERFNKSFYFKFALGLGGKDGTPAILAGNFN